MHCNIKFVPLAMNIYPREQYAKFDGDNFHDL